MSNLRGGIALKTRFAERRPEASRIVKDEPKGSLTESAPRFDITGISLNRFSCEAIQIFQAVQVFKAAEGFRRPMENVAVSGDGSRGPSAVLLCGWRLATGSERNQHRGRSLQTLKAGRAAQNAARLSTIAQGTCAPATATYTEYSDVLAVMNRRLRRGPPKVRLATFSGRRILPSNVPSAAKH